MCVFIRLFPSICVVLFVCVVVETFLLAVSIRAVPLAKPRQGENDENNDRKRTHRRSTRTDERGNRVWGVYACMCCCVRVLTRFPSSRCFGGSVSCRVAPAIPSFAPPINIDIDRNNIRTTKQITFNTHSSQKRRVHYTRTSETRYTSIVARRVEISTPFPSHSPTTSLIRHGE